MGLEEYRVVWRREHDKRRRYRKYQTRRAAENFAEFLAGTMGDPEWGMTGELEYYLKDLGKITELLIESRPVGVWVTHERA